MSFPLHADTERAILSMAKIKQCEPAVVVDMLLNHWLNTSDSSADEPRQAPVGTGLQVHATYRRTRVSGTFDPVGRRLRITDGPCAGQEFSSPSAAAIAVVSTLNPERANPATSGLAFWRLANGRDLRSLDQH